jgi:hypothetical protein
MDLLEARDPALVDGTVARITVAGPPPPTPHSLAPEERS